MARVLIALLVSLVATGAWAGPTARTVAGVVEGVDRDGVSRFLSMPYAAPPTGERRWRAPAPAEPWTGVRPAVAFGPSCTQNISAKGWGPWTGEFSPQGAVSEDCLTLSVWTPALRPGQKAAVMVWLPGGGFTDGGEATAVRVPQSSGYGFRGHVPSVHVPGGATSSARRRRSTRPVPRRRGTGR
jgi:para-nitrobenzyl esterase